MRRRRPSRTSATSSPSRSWARHRVSAATLRRGRGYARGVNGQSLRRRRPRDGSRPSSALNSLATVASTTRCSPVRRRRAAPARPGGGGPGRTPRRPRSAAAGAAGLAGAARRRPSRQSRPRPAADVDGPPADRDSALGHPAASASTWPVAAPTATVESTSSSRPAGLTIVVLRPAERRTRTTTDWPSVPRGAPPARRRPYRPPAPGPSRPGRTPRARALAPRRTAGTSAVPPHGGRPQLAPPDAAAPPPPAGRGGPAWQRDRHLRRRCPPPGRRRRHGMGVVSATNARWRHAYSPNPLAHNACAVERPPHRTTAPGGIKSVYRLRSRSPDEAIRRRLTSNARIASVASRRTPATSDSRPCSPRLRQTQRAVRPSPSDQAASPSSDPAVEGPQPLALVGAASQHPNLRQQRGQHLRNRRDLPRNLVDEALQVVQERRLEDLELGAVQVVADENPQTGRCRTPDSTPPVA